MAREVFRIEGLKELDQALTELPKSTARSVLQRTLREASTPIVTEAERLAPRLTGALQTSIDTGTKLTRRQKRLHRKESQVEVFVGAGGLAQATQQEFGNAHHPAQPFLRPAWDSNAKGVLDRIKDVLTEQIEKTRARIAKKAEREAAKLKAGA